MKKNDAIIDTVKVILWGIPIGYLHQESNGMIGFQYDKDFLESRIQISPICMPLSATTYIFPTLPEVTYHGLPGMIADSLPDRFGNIVIKRYLESQGRSAEDLSVLERLCYTGKRGMGALEYEPSADIAISNNAEIHIDALSKLAADILSEKSNIHIMQNDGMIAQLMECSSSAGGARAKTLIAWNRETGDIRSGQINAGAGYEYWLLKFGNVDNNKDKDVTPDDREYTKIEYAYYLMAIDAGIKMNECKLYTENGKSHFMTKRFDRIGTKGNKVHMQSLCAIAHMDYNSPRVYSYEEAFTVMEKLQLPYHDFLQLYSRMVFNDCSKNYDDHTKNISFLMDPTGTWRLSPAYDITYSYSKTSSWTNAHQMTINGKTENITKDDLLKVASYAKIKKKDAIECIERVNASINNWESFADKANMSTFNIERIKKVLQL